MRRAVTAALGLALLLAGCGEEDPDLDLGERGDEQVIADQAGILDASVEDALRGIEDWDVVAVAYETPQANAGEAHRAGEAVVEAWDADVALVSVAAPGDFTSTEDDRRRFFGATPADVRAVPGGLREELAEEVVPPHAADNDWPAAFVAAAERLGEELE